MEFADFASMRLGESESSRLVEICVGDWRDPEDDGAPPLLAEGAWQCDCSSNYIHWSADRGGEDECEECGMEAFGSPVAVLYEMASDALRAEGFFNPGEREAFNREYRARGYDELALAYALDQANARRAALGALD